MTTKTQGSLAFDLTLTFKDVDADQVVSIVSAVSHVGSVTATPVLREDPKPFTLVEGRADGSVPEPPALPAPEVASVVSGWDKDAGMTFINGLTPDAFKVVQYLVDHDGVASIDDLLRDLGVKSGKALGGIRSSFGHGLNALRSAGREDLHPLVIRDIHSREFRLDPRSHKIINRAVRERAKSEAKVASARAAHASGVRTTA